MYSNCYYINNNSLKESKTSMGLDDLFDTHSSMKIETLASEISQSALNYPKLN